MIKDKPTSWCKPGWDRKDPCLTCTADAMCTMTDDSTGKTKHTFYKGYKKEQRVRILSDPLIFTFIGWGSISGF